MPFSFVQPVIRNDYKCLNVNTAYVVRGRERFGAAVPDMQYAVVSELACIQKYNFYLLVDFAK